MKTMTCRQLGGPCDQPHHGDTADDVIHAVGLMVERCLVLELAAADYPVPVHIVPAPCPIDVSPTDFSHSDELIERARDVRRAWLDAGQPHDLSALGLHTHS